MRVEERVAQLEAENAMLREQISQLWASYDHYRCRYSICGAHVLRDLTYEHEQQGQVWAEEMKEVLLGMHAAACQWRERGATRLPALERDEWVIQYFDVLARGF